MNANLLEGWVTRESFLQNTMMEPTQEPPPLSEQVAFAAEVLRSFEEEPPHNLPLMQGLGVWALPATYTAIIRSLRELARQRDDVTAADAATEALAAAKVRRRPLRARLAQALTGAAPLALQTQLLVTQLEAAFRNDEAKRRFNAGLDAATEPTEEERRQWTLMRGILDSLQELGRR